MADVDLLHLYFGNVRAFPVICQGMCNWIYVHIPTISKIDISLIIMGNKNTIFLRPANSSSYEDRYSKGTMYSKGNVICENNVMVNIISGY